MLGKNGVRVNGVHHLPGGDRVPLPSQSLLQIGEVRALRASAHWRPRRKPPLPLCRFPRCSRLKPARPSAGLTLLAMLPCGHPACRS